MNIDEIIAFHEITQLKYRYLRAVDTQDWTLLASVFAANVRTWYDKGKLTTQGREAAVKGLADHMGPAVHSHHIAVHPEITLTGPTTAKGVWRFQDIVWFDKAHPNPLVPQLEGGERLIGAGYYYDEYEKENGAWKISSTGFVRIFESVEAMRNNPDVTLRSEPAYGKLNG
jgi:hypothetical protein